MDKAYIAEEHYDVDGGFGDAIPETKEKIIMKTKKTLTYRPFAKLFKYRPSVEFPWLIAGYVSVNKKVVK